PHLTLACFNDVDEARCVEKLRTFARTHKTVPAWLGSVGMFTDTRTIFLSPVMTRSMYQLQGELHEHLKEFDTGGWAWYRPENWVPHCTVALTKEDDGEAFYRASDLVLREFEKMSGEFTAIGLVKVTFPVEELYTAELSR
ncbi:MAG: 2'-5' RNA ligase family protein, partial [Oscillospiraceae bacterium]|nr:2'-5' RNA ligase family protein [Oscillospiraceae bacterium]